jgi:hypothetical protein
VIPDGFGLFAGGCGLTRSPLTEASRIFSAFDSITLICGVDSHERLHNKFLDLPPIV